MSTKITEYRDCHITLNEKFQFLVSSALDLHFPRGNAFESLALAKAAIDSALKIIGIKAKRKLSLPVLNDISGKREFVHGIHAIRGTLLGLSDASTRYGNSSDALPDIDWVAALIEERRRLQDRVNEIDHILRGYRIEHYRGRVSEDAGVYEEALKLLEREHAEKTKKARELNDRPQVIYAKPEAQS